MQENTLEREQEDNSELLARLFKYYLHQKKSTLPFHPSLDHVKAATLYRKNIKRFKKLSFIFGKYGIDADKYIRFCVDTLGIRNAEDLLKVDNFVHFANNMKIESQYKKIYSYYIKSATYVAEESIRNGTTPREFVVGLIRNNKLAYEYMCGNLSMYYIATLGNPEKICEYLDKNSADELSIIFSMREKLNQDVQDTFIKFKNKTVSPIGLAETILKNKLTKPKAN